MEHVWVDLLSSQAELGFASSHLQDQFAIEWLARSNRLHDGWYCCECLEKPKADPKSSLGISLVCYPLHRTRPLEQAFWVFFTSFLSSPKEKNKLNSTLWGNRILSCWPWFMIPGLKVDSFPCLLRNSDINARKNREWDSDQKGATQHPSARTTPYQTRVRAQCPTRKAQCNRKFLM